MRDLVRELAESAHRHYIVLGRSLYQVQRVNSDQLRLHGWASLEGSASVKPALEEVDKQRAALQARVGGKTIAADPAALQALQALQLAKLHALTSRPEGASALLDRWTAYVCAAVVGLGALREGVSYGAAAVLPPEVDPSSVALDLRDAKDLEAGRAPAHFQAIRYVQDEASEDLDAGVVWVHRLTAEQRTTLGGVIVSLQSVASEVTPFRRAAGAAGDVLSAGEEVREVAARGAGAESVPDGLQPGRGAGRGKGRSRGSRSAEARVPGDPARLTSGG